jgi:2,3-bisphosphoglycerate-dependent phosphoglycerate mutase
VFQSEKILLVRHCQATSQAPDAPLTPAGTADAIKLRERLERLGVDAVNSSPFRRALETVSPFAEGRALIVRVDDRLAERRLANSPQDDWLAQIRLSFGDLDHRAPGGESLREAQSRGLAVLAQIASAGHRLPAVSTHGNLLAAMLRSVDETFGFAAWQGIGNPDLFRLSCEGGRPISFERLPAL